MDGDRLYRRLRRVADIRPDETRTGLLLFLYFFLITFAFYIVKPVKENLQIRVNQAYWPLFELGTAVLIGFVVAFNARQLNRLPRRKYSNRTLVFFIANVLVFWLVFHLISPATRTFFIPSLLPLFQRHWFYFAFVFSLWSDIFIAISVTQFWIAVNDAFHPHQAKRLIGPLVSGGLLGGIAGSLLTLGLVPLIGRTNLLLVCGAALVLTILVVNGVHAEREKARGAERAEPVRAGTGIGYLESLRTVRESKYLRLLAGVLATAMIVGALINYQFKLVVKEAYANEDERTAFIATFFLVILVVSTAFHMVTTERILRTFKIRWALLLAPAVLLLGSVSALALPAAAAITLTWKAWTCGLRGADKTFDNTISQSVRELLYIPIPAEIKYKAKIFIDLFVNKVGGGFGAVLFWVIYRVSDFPGKSFAAQVQELGFWIIGFCVLWIGLITVIYAEYLGVVQQELQRKWQDGDKVVREHVDMDATRLLFDILQSRQKSSTLYAMNLFRLIQMEKLTPEIREILAFKEDEIRAQSVDALLDVGGEVFYQGIEDAMSAKDFEVIIREIVALPSYKLLMEKELGEIAGTKSESEVVRMEAARLMGFMEPTPGVIHSLGRMLQDPSPDVLNYALGSAAIHLRKEHVPLIIALLGSPMNRQVAQETLAAYGPRIDDTLKKHLLDRAELPEVRRAIPEVLARFANEKAADILTAELARGEEELEQELIDALYKIRADRPDIRFHVKNIRAAVLSVIRAEFTALLAGGGHGPAPEVKAALDLRTKRIFDLLTLIYPSEDIVKAYQNILQGTRKSVDYSLELLDYHLDRELKAFLFPLIEDLAPEERARRLRKLARSLGGVPL